MVCVNAQWKTSSMENWKLEEKRELHYGSDTDRDPTGDELNAEWAVKQLRHLAHKEQPFFMGVGFVRPHTPLIVPKKYFDKFPLESISLPVIKDRTSRTHSNIH